MEKNTTISRVGVTGASGLVGSFVVRALLARGYEVVALRRPGQGPGLLADVADRLSWQEGDVLDIDSLEQAFGQVQWLIHTAAIVSFAPPDRAAMYRVNVEGTANVVNTALRLGIAKLGFVSSVAALGRPDNAPKGIPYPIDEGQQWVESSKNSHYARSKFLAEMEVWRGIAEGLSGVIVCPSLVLGEGDWQRSSTQIFKYVFDEKPFYTEGLMNYVDVRDVAEAVCGLMESAISEQRFVLSAGSVPFGSLFEKIAQHLNKRPPRYRVAAWMTQILWRIEALRGRLTGARPLITRETAESASHHFEYQGQKITHLLPFRYRSLAETLERCAGYFLKNHP
jgi:dihydroflavonol-4-reductase